MTVVRKFDAGPRPEFKIVNTVKDVLKRVKAGKVTALAVVVVQTDGTFWSGAACATKPEDLPTVALLGMLRLLEEDLVRWSYDEPGCLSP